jgi:AcrR family transcriptional regulator
VTAAETGRPAPPSRRGQRTRAALVAAARTVFERDGFLDARITDIAAEAGTATGTFYTYFESKEEIFRAVVEEVQEDWLHPRLRERLGEEDPLALIDAANRDYLLAYKRNARLMALFEQVAQIDDEFRELRRKRGAAFVRRNAKMIRRLQDSGRADPDLDPLIAAHALSGMVGRIAYSVFNLGERIPFERLVTTLNQLWANALKLDQPVR